MFTVQVNLFSVAADLMVHDDTRPPTLSRETQTKELDRQIDREVSKNKDVWGHGYGLFWVGCAAVLII